MARITGGTVIAGGESLGERFGNSLIVPSGVTIQSVIDAASAGDTIYIQPGEYDEEVTIPATLSKLVIIGQGGRGAVYIAPSTGNKTALTNNAEDVTLINVGCDGEGTGGGLVNTGRRFRAYDCKFEGGAFGAKMTLGTVAQEAAGTHGDGSDCWLVDCEFAWTTDGLLIECTDYGAVTQLHVKGGLVHNCTNGINESVGSGGSAAVMFQNVTIDGVTFDDADDGTAPTAYILLNDDNANSGVVTRCSFPTAINGGKNLVSTALHWVGNLHTGGLSTAQPS